MTQEKFDELVFTELTYIENLLTSKGREYTGRDKDRLIAFKHAAALNKENPQRALLGMLSKHIVSIYQMCEPERATAYKLETWGEKITDAINYLLLLLAIVKEQHDEEYTNTDPKPRRDL